MQASEIGQRQQQLLQTLVTAARRVRDAVAAGNLAHMLDAAARQEELLERLWQLEEQTGVPTALSPETAAQVQEYLDLQEENRLLLRRAHERTAFRLQLLTGSTVSLVDSRV